jgi:mannose-1-phosphate guanylyltransferase / mannose-6-phosphate isomerase
MLNIVPAIMCGGAGTRLWPISRESMPKQFIPLFGEKSTFQQVMERVTSSNIFARPIVITTAEFRFLVAEQLRECKVDAQVVLEPVRRDSGPTVALAATMAAANDPDALVLVLAADHMIRNSEAFLAACKEAAAEAAKGRIITFGVMPNAPVTSYGYIKPGKNLSGNIQSVDAFVEKPNRQTAEEYIRSGYLWNSGNFLFHAKTMLSEIQRLEPIMLEAVTSAVNKLEHDLNFVRLPAAEFKRAPAKSIDYSVLEHTSHAAVLPVDLGWSDVGNWASVWEILDHDSHGNATTGHVVLHESENCLVQSEEPILTALIGLNDVVVISTPDAVLVCARSKAEQLKTVVNDMKLRNYRVAVEHRRVHRPWGYFQEVDNASRYKVKRIVVTPGSTLSLQKHFHRSEHWVVVRGTAEVTVVCLYTDRKPTSPRQPWKDRPGAYRGPGWKLLG